jgi:putative NADH-flavin reductase
VKIAVIGASGWLGGSIAREAVGRGHSVTAVGRSATRLDDIEGATAVVADLDDPDSIVRAVQGSDVVVSSVTDRTTDDRSRIPDTARALLEILPRAGVHRVAFVGGGGSLEVEPGRRVVDAPGFPAQYRAEALAQAEALDLLRDTPGPIEWTYISPPPHLLEPGPRTGRYAVQGGDSPVVNTAGESRITSGDFASALVDELEQNRFPRQRFTAGS